MYKRNIKARSRNHCCREKQLVHIPSVCHLHQSSSTQSTCAVLDCHLWSVRVYHIFPHYLTDSTAFEKEVIEPKMCVDFLYNFSLKHFSFYEDYI
jgi:hypothetical protein